jgi:hypothetical protein
VAPNGEWIVYDRSVWRDFLLGRLLRDRARLVQADPSDLCADLLAIAADAPGFIFHLDCTVTARFPFCRHQLIDGLVAAGRTVLNSRAVDLSKPALQRICGDLALPTTIASAEGDAAELVIVKTTLNSLGAAERLLPAAMRNDLGLPPLEAVNLRRGYRVMPRRQVPAAWWHDPALTIERFVANHSDVYYRVYVCRKMAAVACAYRPGRVKKMVCGATRNVALVDLANDPEFVSLDVPFPVRQVARFVARLGLDFGTLDVVRDDRHSFHIIDANATPYWCEEIPGVLDHLGAGFALDRHPSDDGSRCD